MMPTPTPPGPRWLDPTEMRAWRAYISVVGDLTSALDRDLQSIGLTLGDYHVLVYLSETDDHSMRMCDLAEVLQLSPSGLTRRLDGLVRAGWVAREGSAADRRVMLAVLTAAGRRELERAAPLHVESVRRLIVDRLSREQLTAMGDIFTTLGEALATEDSGELDRSA